MIALTWGAILVRTRESADREPLPRADLRLWDIPGCYRVSGEPWPDGAGEVAALPGHFMLVADSLDEWGRTYDTYRAEPLDAGPGGAQAGGSGPAGRAYRWFIRADTLWVVWSDDGVRGGLALRRSGEGLLGRARVGGPEADVDVTARVQAWKVNCGTREIESTSRLRR